MRVSTVRNVMTTAVFFLFSQIMMAQCSAGNCIEGKGTMLFEGGAKYIGDFVGGRMHGQGILYFTSGDKYLGTFVNQQREGQGKYVFTNGNQYIGAFHQSRFEGQGVMSFANGDKYNGNWDNDQPNGKGVYSFKSGNEYNGTLSNGEFQGIGTMVYADGSKYVGSWKSSRRSGKGAMYNAYSVVLKNGTWENDIFIAADNSAVVVTETKPQAKPQPKPKPQDAVVVTNTTKPTTTTKTYKNCNEAYCSDCEGQYTYLDGSKFTGDFMNGYPEGNGTMAYISGDKYVGGWKSHSPHGEGIMHYKSGRVLGAEWRLGEMVRELDGPIENSKEEVVRDYNPAVKIWALVVGVGRYTSMPVLKYTDDDAYQMYAFLKSPEGGALPENQVKVLIDDDATSANILYQMRQLFLKADENDVVMLYFSGHGIDGAFIPVDYDGYNHRLKHESVKAIFNESVAKHKVCIADACFSGGLLAAKSANAVESGKYYKELEDVKGGMALLMSSKSQEYSLEDQGLRSGVFSYYLRKGLHGDADTNKNKIVTIKELFDYVYVAVRDHTGNQQNPNISGNFSPLMPIGMIR
jgi:hypothetical protein